MSTFIPWTSQNGRLVVQTAPTTEPVTFADVQAQVRIDDADEQTLVETYITAARKYVEDYTRRTLIDTTYDLYFASGFPGTEIIIPRPPLQSITSITYLDTNGASQTFASGSYQVDAQSEPGRVKPEPTTSWPATDSGNYDTVIIRFLAGYGSAATDVPEGLRLAIQMLAGHWFTHREPVIVGHTVTNVPHSIERILWSFRVPEFT